MRKLGWILAGLAGTAGLAAMANAENRLPRQCRQEIVKLCGTDRSQMRSCLMERRNELSADCREALKQRIQGRHGTQGGQSGASAPRPDETISYGTDKRQAVDFYAVNGADTTPPLILFVHGGGWVRGDRVSSLHAKPEHFTQGGYAFASTGYRLLPDSPVEEQAADIGRALGALRQQAKTLGFDANRIVLMGHSAGAHLAALIATDPQYTRNNDFQAIAGVVLLDGAGYDVPANMAGDRNEVPRLYLNAFGSDPARQAALSPITHVGGPDAPDWLVLHVANRANSREQSQDLATALCKEGADARSQAVPNSTHASINQDLGKDSDFATGKVDAWLNKLFN